MKKIIFLLTFISITKVSFPQGIKDINLPEPNKKGGMPIMEALSLRQSKRAFSNVELTMQQLADLLWAACGINRPDEGKRTAPSAMNDQEIDIYVSLKTGVYLYDAEKNMLKAIKEGDFRKDMGRQGFVADAPVVLVYVADYSKMSVVMSKDSKDFYAATDVGFISQNVYLYAASEKMATVVLGMFDRGDIAKAIPLTKNQKVLLTQPVGFPK
ncbi:MAG: Nitroreductase family protein [Bacteroidetes bacterium ADurb.Bin408]|nr:MAG: Nitroreductase family protein [Bacteroidetes bacterium ADurb.Bin408]